MRTPVTQAFIKLPHFIECGNRAQSSKSQEISKRLKKLIKIHPRTSPNSSNSHPDFHLFSSTLLAELSSAARAID